MMYLNEILIPIFVIKKVPLLLQENVIKKIYYYLVNIHFNVIVKLFHYLFIYDFDILCDSPYSQILFHKLLISNTRR